MTRRDSRWPSDATVELWRHLTTSAVHELARLEHDVDVVTRDLERQTAAVRDLRERLYAAEARELVADAKWRRAMRWIDAVMADLEPSTEQLEANR